LIGAAYVALFALFAWTRFHAIDRIGVARGDANAYITVAKAWADGNFTVFRTNFMRPVGYALFGGVARVFGNPAVSIKCFNAALDVLCLILIVLLVNNIARRRWAGIPAGLFYLLMPEVIQFSRMEYLHQPANAFTLASFACLYFGMQFNGRWRPPLFFGLSGLWMGAAFLIHPSVALFGAVAVAGLAFHCFWSLRPDVTFARRWRLFVIQAALYTIGYFVLLSLCFAYYGPERVIDSFVGDRANQSEYTALLHDIPSNPLIAILVTVRDTFSHCLGAIAQSRVHLGLLLLAAPLILWSMLRPDTKRRSIPLATGLAMLLLFSFTFYLAGGGFDRGSSRLFVNVVGIYTVCVAGGLFLAAESFPTGRPRFVALTVAVILLTSPVVPIGRSLFAGKLDSMYQPNIYQWTYLQLRDRVGPDAKLLIFPSIFYNERALRYDYYLGPNAIYLNGLPYTPGNSLDKLFAQENIRYLVWFEQQYDFRLLNEDYRRQYDFPRNFYGHFENHKIDYSLGRERILFRHCLLNYDASIVAESDYGTIYELSGGPAPAIAFDTNLLVDPDDFSAITWSKSNRMEAAPSGESNDSVEGIPQRVVAGFDGRLYQGDALDVRGGQTARAAVRLWAADPTRVELSVGRNGHAKYEGSAIVAELTSTPRLFEVTHRFAADHPSARIMLRSNTPDREIEFFAAAPRLERFAPAPDTE
jgi:4-amino-4-deoxy-L-arabinose transferase-like glycosyltransferase